MKEGPLGLWDFNGKTPAVMSDVNLGRDWRVCVLTWNGAVSTAHSAPCHLPAQLECGTCCHGGMGLSSTERSADLVCVQGWRCKDLVFRLSFRSLEMVVRAE